MISLAINSLMGGIFYGNYGDLSYRSDLDKIIFRGVLKDHFNYSDEELKNIEDFQEELYEVSNLKYIIEQEKRDGYNFSMPIFHEYMETSYKNYYINEFTPTTPEQREIARQHYTPQAFQKYEEIADAYMKIKSYEEFKRDFIEEFISNAFSIMSYSSYLSY